ncbi:MAG: hypothetical protein K8F91_14590 [Candidatus Obscuribacterales bacterium]|nr:hypothetical protein [Candidatus Obscuribacterales bacterium]
MTILTNSRKSIGSRVVLVAASLSFLGSSLLPAAAFSISGRNSKASLQMPVNDKIDLESLPEVATPEAPAQEAESKPDISPISLDSGTEDDTDAAPEAGKLSDKQNQKEPDSGKGHLKATVRSDQFIPKGPLEGKQNLLAPTSVKGSKATGISVLGNSTLEQAKAVNAAPLPLIESADDAANKLDETRELERQQLTALWEATLTRSPDINFVLQKLMPSSDPSKVTTLLMRALGTAAMTGLGAMSAISPGPTSYMSQNLGYTAINGILGLQDSKNAKKQKITQTESIMLYNMIRDTADKVVSNYRDYKKVHTSLLMANADFEHLKRMAAAAKGGQDAAKQLEVEYTLKKQQRDIEESGADLSKVRQQLVDLAGPQAVTKLDTEIDEEIRKLHPEMVAPETAPARQTLIADPGSKDL